MAIRDVVTAGFGNGSFNSTIAFAVLRGYAIAPVIAIRNLVRTLTRDLTRTMPYVPTDNKFAQ